MSSGQETLRVSRLLVLLAIAAAAMAGGIWTAQQFLPRSGKVDNLASMRFPEAREIGAFELLDHTGAPFSNAALHDHWSFVFFGYTHCPDVCPATLSVLNSVAQRLGGSEPPARFIFITLDPQRDTAEKLASYVTYFNGDFLGITGTPDAIGQLTGELGVMSMQVANEASPESYLIDHTAAVFLFDPDGRYHAVFTPPLEADEMAGAFRQIREEY